jgi:hypothetical protein
MGNQKLDADLGVLDVLDRSPNKKRPKNLSSTVITLQLINIPTFQLFACRLPALCSFFISGNWDQPSLP